MTQVIDSILETRKQLEAQHCENGCIFLAFWDFDGTVLKGDCSEGLREDGKLIYRGLVELTIEQGFSSEFRRNEAAEFEKEYRRRDKELGHRNAYTFLTTQYGGSDPDEILEFAKNRFSEVYSDHYFESSMHIWNSLEKSGVQNHVISASPHFFVQGAAETLSIAPDRINGVRLQIKDGKLLPILDPPLTYAEGKTETLENVVSRIKKENPEKTVFVLAGFGNSYHTDGHFLRSIKERDLPAGKTYSIMINGGAAPEEFKDLFWTVDQSATVGAE